MRCTRMTENDSPPAVQQLAGAEMAFEAHTDDVGFENVVYFLIMEDEVVYVGQSAGHLESRIRSHERDKAFERVFVLMVGKKENLNAVESAFIRYYKPFFNKDRSGWLVTPVRNGSYEGDFNEQDALVISQVTGVYFPCWQEA